MTIHSTAVVGKNAKIADDVTVGPFACIEDDVEIGAGTRVGPHATILAHTTIGKGCTIHAGAVLGDVPQDLAFDGSVSYVRIGNNCTIREGVTVHRGTGKGTVTEIGDDCFFMALSHFAHNVKVGNRVIVANGSHFGGHVQIGDRAFISGNCTAHQFTRIGKLAMLGGNSSISKDVPPFFTIHPVSCNVVSSMNVVGMRRAGMDADARAQVKVAFKVLYKSGLNTSQAVNTLRERFDCGPVLEICDFVESAERGICGHWDP
jgi:UDP-N-acetylglucosamine acyltransferase